MYDAKRLNKDKIADIVKQLSRDKDLYASIEDDKNPAKALAQFDLNAVEVKAILDHDFELFSAAGLDRDVLELAGWCTGD